MNNLGCSFLESGINFDLNMVCDCCISHNDGRGLPILINKYKGGPINWEEIFEKKQKRIESQKEQTIYECEGCYHLCDYKFSSEKKISEFHFSHCRICNARCIYCSNEYSAGPANYDTYPVIKDLIDKGYYAPGGEATFQGGEPTLMQSFDELVHLFTENGTKVRIHTSGIKYSSTVEEALRQNKGSIVISLDSGNRETYKKIKRVDAFDTVLNNIEKYSKANTDNIIIKYIIVPGYNDTLDEIDAFFNRIKKYNIKHTALDIEVRYARFYNNKDVSPHIFLLADYFEKKAAENNINLLTYSFISYVLKNRNIKKSKLINSKFLYSLYLNTKRESNKNLKDYRK